jgi:hypothetical protein
MDKARLSQYSMSTKEKAIGVARLIMAIVVTGKLPWLYKFEAEAVNGHPARWRSHLAASACLFLCLRIPPLQTSSIRDRGPIQDSMGYVRGKRFLRSGDYWPYIPSQFPSFSRRFLGSPAVQSPPAIGYIPAIRPKRGPEAHHR